MILFNGGQLDWIAYEQGLSASEELTKTGAKINNPYERDTASWLSWNRGWNDDNS
jgi:hypothetical protein